MINDAQAGAFAEGFQQENRIKAQVVQTEVLNAINQARKDMSADPDAASQNLQLMLQNVRQQADLNPDVRDQLSEQLRTALREAARRKVEVEFRRQQQQESMAAARERQLITDNLLHNQQRLKQLMDRFDSLMDESRYQMFELDQTKAREAEEQAAYEAMKLAPECAGAGSSGDISPGRWDIIRNRWRFIWRSKRRLWTRCILVDESAIPFPDDPPIVYPSAEVWQQLSARRLASDVYRPLEPGTMQVGRKHQEGVEIGDENRVCGHAPVPGDRLFEDIITTSKSNLTPKCSTTPI